MKIKRIFFIGLLSLLAVGSCSEPKVKEKNKYQLINDSTKVSSHKDSLSLLFEDLAANNYIIDTSFNLGSQTYLTNIIMLALENQKTNKQACECVDSVRLYKIHKKDFNPQKNQEYFSYASKGYDSQIYLTVWYFESKSMSQKCLDENRLAFIQSQTIPMVSTAFTLQSYIISVEPASGKENQLYNEVRQTVGIKCVEIRY